MSVKTALILCAGFGKRLEPLTKSIPKPLLKIKDITLLDVAEGEEWPEESVDEVISASNESIENNKVPLDVADDKNDKKSNENNVSEESKEGPVEMEWDVNDDNNQELDDNGQIKIF